MEIKDILTALDCLHKMVPFMKGISLIHPDIESYPKELEEKLDVVFRQAEERVNPQEKVLIFRFKELYALNNLLLKNITEESVRYNDKKDNIFKKPTEYEKMRYNFFNKVSIPMFEFSYHLQVYPWGLFLHYENLGDRGALFSPEENWPENLDAIHIVLRTFFLEQAGDIENLYKTYGSLKLAFQPLADHYRLKVISLQNKNKEANEIIKTPPRERSDNRVNQLKIVKDWLERDNYSKAANLIIM